MSHIPYPLCRRNDGIYSVVPILYLEVLREEDGDDGWDPVDAEGDGTLSWDR